MKKSTCQKLREEVSALLEAKLSQREAEELRKEGFELKKPTRTAAIAIALYKKAAAGDLSAVKELRSMLCEDTSPETGRGVTIIDDIGN